MRPDDPPLVGVVMGSKSDWETMRHADEVLDPVRRPPRVPRRLGPPHARLAGRVRRTAPKARGHRGDHRRRRRRRPPAGHGGGPDAPAGARRAGREPGAQGARLAAVDRPDARRRAGRDAGHRQGRGGQRRPAGRRASWPTTRPELREKLRRVPRGADRGGCAERPCLERALDPSRASTIGVLGSGQLGRMFAIAARRMGYRVHTLSPGRRHAHRPGGRPRGQSPPTTTSTPSATSRAGVDVVTFEFENVSAGDRRGRRRARARPARRARSCTPPSTGCARRRSSPAPASRSRPSRRSARVAELRRGARASSARPAILKTAGLGYDGKGQVQIAAPAGRATPPGRRSAARRRSSRPSSTSSARSRWSPPAGSTARSPTSA